MRRAQLRGHCRYPGVAVTRLRGTDAWLNELEARLLLVYLGRSHSSTAVHESVLRDVTGIGAGHPALESLRLAAAAARDAVLAGDFSALGAAMAANTEAQRRLHPALIGADAARVIDAASACGAAGWKVNGAGGEGGSVALLASRVRAARGKLEDAVSALPAACRLIPLRLARQGLVTVCLPT